MASDELGAAEIRQLLGETLSRFGVAGEVTVGTKTATLHGSGPTVEADLGILLDQWPGLPHDQRQRRVNELARRLANERRALTSMRGAPRSSALPEWIAPLGIGTAVLVVALGAWTAYRQWFGGNAVTGGPEPVIRDYDAYERERAERAGRVCEATRSRVMRGAAVGPADVEGWVVELWLLRSPDKPSLLAEPAIAQFVAPAPGGSGSRFVWPGATSIASLDGPDTGAQLLESNLPATGDPVWRGLRVVLTGRYVVPYFHETQRFDYVKFARAFTDALGADHAGLYARCADGQSHHLGSWFRGPTPGGAVASLLYFVGTTGDHPDVRGSLLVPEGKTEVDPVLAFRNLGSATAALKKTRVMAMVGAEGGMISGLDAQTSTIAFPFRDSNRAARASHVIARDLGIGENR